MSRMASKKLHIMQFYTALCYFLPFVLRENFQETEKLRTFVWTGRVKWNGTSNIARRTKHAALHRNFMLHPYSGLLKEVVEAQVVSTLPLRHSITLSVWMEISTALSTGDVWEYVTGGNTSPVFSLAAQLSVKSSKVLTDSGRLQNASEVRFRCQSSSEKRLLTSPYPSVLTEQHDDTPRWIFFCIIIYLSWSWATCWPVPVSRIQKYLQRSAMIPSASWGIVYHYPG